MCSLIAASRHKSLDDDAASGCPGNSGPREWAVRGPDLFIIAEDMTP
jgi:hypothetical protein